MPEELIKNIKDLAGEHNLAPGTSMCAGCGALETVKLFCDILGKNTVFVNAAGCMTLLSIYPFTPFSGSWLYTAMASASAGAQGIRDALDILIKKGKLSADEDLKVVVLTGDGSAYGMGLSSTSAAIDRGLDFYYLCYDNEGYGNTGQQDSAATPHGARTATSASGAGFTGNKKDLFSIWAAHKPAYLATVIAAEPMDLARKVETAMTIKGPKMFITLAPCPTGWHYEPHQTVNIGKLAVKTGTWPLKEYKDEKVTHTKILKERLPVEEYLKLQGRFEHLFIPEKNLTLINRIQATVDQYWKDV
ncbi:MAG TPA: thiamine pyrophosphate-dependent enzyme [Spirochaetota bacterium]|nr:thiamine pyrophosphate-dependent enzyme [Spirochaetota bacterium]HPR38345.1 thiamine pyrophosphate-dependent enzyme [Spirochaetota bacterium]